MVIYANEAETKEIYDSVKPRSLYPWLSSQLIEGANFVLKFLKLKKGN